MRFVLQFDPALTACVFVLLMALAWRIGIRVGQRSEIERVYSRFDDGALALFGLVLAFSFAGAAARYDFRKKLVLSEATALGDFSGTIVMLAEPQRSQLVREVHRYVEERLLYGRLKFEDPKTAPLMADTRSTQGRITALVEQAIRSGNTPSVHTPLVNNLNQFTTAYDNRLQGQMDHIPGTVGLMLVLFGLFSTYTMGRLADGMRGVSALGYMVFVGLVFWVTLDMETPRRGFLHVSQHPMEELQHNLPSPNTR